MSDSRRGPIVIVAFALVASLLVVTAPMAGASNGTLVVASQHTDFGTGSEQSPQKTTNMTVSGSGDDASVVFDPPLSINDTYTGSLSGYTEVQDGGAATWSTVNGELEADITITGTEFLIRDSPSQVNEFTVETVISQTDGNSQMGVVPRYYDADNYIEVRLNNFKDNFNLRFVENGNSVNVQESYDFQGGTDYRVVAETQNGGQSIEARLYAMNGTLLATVSDDIPTGLRSGGQVGVVATGDNDEFGYWNYLNVTKENLSSAMYVSAVHDVTNGDQAAINITEASGVSVDATVRTPSGTIVNQTTLTTTDNHTLHLNDYAGDQLEVKLGITKTASDPRFELADESILFKDRPPTIDNSSATPAGSLSSSPSSLSIDAIDKDFGVAQGESVTVEFFHKGPSDSSFSSAGTDTLTSNGTASTSVSANDGGTHEWYAVATDSYGEATTSQTFSFEAPATLYIRNETKPSDLVDNPISVTVRFFGDNEVVERTTSSGTVDLSGINVSAPFIVTAEATGDFAGRVVRLESIYEQQSIYMLNTSAMSTVETRFQLEDPTGEFGSESTLTIEKPINRSGTTRYRIIYRDKFGVEGVTAVLESNRRYRLSVTSPERVTQDLGPYRADVGETVTVRPGSPSIDLGQYDKGWDWGASLDNRTLEYAYDDPENLTDSVTVAVYERGNASNLLRPNQTFTNQQSISGQYILTKNESEKVWVVELEIDRDSETFTVSTVVQKRADLVLPGLSQEWRTITGIVALFIFAGIFSVLNRAVGALMVGVFGGILWWTGWLAGATTGAAVVLYLFISVLYVVYTTGEP